MMAVSKRLRFEVLKRDDHTCRYCGAKAPDAKLTVDHVTPVALGGTDDASNLVAACCECNSGKSSTTPTDDLVAQVGEDDMRWAAAIQRAAAKMLEEQKGQGEKRAWFLKEWDQWDEKHLFLPSTWTRALDHWVGSGLPREVLIECLDIALRNRHVSADSVFAYMGGVARKKIEQLHEMARADLDEATDDGS